ncbi:hypothetical protein ACCS60_27890 [Rhizobium acaciae]|uniref:hypothetical protein n=1 Tax=Rhizobium acaciae TaxID=2989736 RepID=UPI003F9EAB40
MKLFGNVFKNNVPAILGEDEKHRLVVSAYSALTSACRNFALTKTTAVKVTRKAVCFTTAEPNPAFIKCYFEQYPFLIELFVYQALRGHASIADLLLVDEDNLVIAMERLEPGNAIDLKFELSWLFETVGSLHASWEKLCIEGREAGIAINGGLTIDDRLWGAWSPQEQIINSAFIGAYSRGYTPLSFGDLKTEHILSDGNRLVLVDFDSAVVGRCDAYDLALGFARLPAGDRPLLSEISQYLVSYDTGRQQATSLVRPLSPFLDEFYSIAMHIRRSLR